jgi:hypothetical protein
MDIAMKFTAIKPNKGDQVDICLHSRHFYASNKIESNAFPIIGDATAFVCVNLTNIKTDKFEIADNIETVIRDLSPGYMVVLDTNAKGIPLRLPLSEVEANGFEGVEDLLIISYFKADSSLKELCNKPTKK